MIDDDPAFRFAHAGYLSTRVIPALAIARSTLAGVARPILGQQSLSHIQVKRRIRPIADAGHEAVLDRIEMNVIDVPRKVVFVANGVLPKPSLPEGIFAVRTAFKPQHPPRSYDC